ncbi:hypothetical protein CPC08DRAFT_726336 [Agrocybe pediades]|nr:hypothetical protein CPC08DRAFT_726336 [Agrocybe pediades]
MQFTVFVLSALLSAAANAFPQPTAANVVVKPNDAVAAREMAQAELDYITFCTVTAGCDRQHVPVFRGVCSDFDVLHANQVDALLDNRRFTKRFYKTDISGVTHNGSLYEKEFKKSYFRSHYADLKAIKKQYDPASLFWVASGVGSEDWGEDLNWRKSPSAIGTDKKVMKTYWSEQRGSEFAMDSQLRSASVLHQRDAVEAAIDDEPILVESRRHQPINDAAVTT